MYVYKMCYGIHSNNLLGAHAQYSVRQCTLFESRHVTLQFRPCNIIRQRYFADHQVLRKYTPDIPYMLISLAKVNFQRGITTQTKLHAIVGGLARARILMKHRRHRHRHPQDNHQSFFGVKFLLILAPSSLLGTHLPTFVTQLLHLLSHTEKNVNI